MGIREGVGWGAVLQEEATGLDEAATKGGRGARGGPWGFDLRDRWVVVPFAERWRKTVRNRFKGGKSGIWGLGILRYKHSC